MKIKAAVALVVLAALVQPAVAQYAAVNTSGKQKREDEEEKRLSELQPFVGRKYWVAYNPNAKNRLIFNEVVDGRVTGNVFVVTEPTSFEIVSFGRGSLNYPRIVFSDGKIAEFHAVPMISSDKKHIFYNEFAPGEDEDLSNTENLHTAPPEAYARAEQRKKTKRAAAAAAWKAKSGVKLGMTAAEVRASQWGPPSKINRTITTTGTREQWVYGGHNYIYLENGLVTAIQN